MGRIITEEEIRALLDEAKPLPHNWAKRLKPRLVSGQTHMRRKLEGVHGDNGNDFVIDLRYNSIQLLDFSIILSLIDHDGQRHILTRFNGKHPSFHTNKWEKKYGKPNASFHPDFHIHKATERYQCEGFDIDGYAELTTHYSSFDSALRFFVQSNGFFIEGEPPTPLLDGVE